MDRWLSENEYWLSPKNKRLQDLQRQFPKLPMALIIQNDLMRCGARPTPDFWAVENANKAPGVTIQNRDHGQFFTTREHQVRPTNFRLPEDTGCLLTLAANGPYEVKRGGPSGKDVYWLYRDSEPVVTINFAPDHHGATGGGVGYTLRHCSYFNTGEQCHFCSITPEQKHRQEIGIESAQQVMDTIEQTKAAIKQRVNDLRAQFGPYLDANIPCGQDNCSCIRSNMTIGALGSYDKEVEYHYSRVRAMREAVPGLPIHLTAGAIKEADAKALAELGVHALCQNLEVWDEKLFEWICAGKAKNVGRDEWLNRLVGAVKYYPKGHVYSNFVAGAEMATPHGFKTVDQALKSTLGGWEWLMQQGVCVYWQIWATAPGSVFQDQVLPPTEFYLSLAEEWYKLIQRYDLFRPTTHWCCKRCSNNPQGPFNRMRWYPGGFPPDNTLRPERPLEEMLKEREQKAQQRKIEARG